MKIDLHCHTKKSKFGDSNDRNIPSIKDFVNSVLEAEVEILGVTNHNEFDITQFNQMREASDSKFAIWPGIELDVKGNKEIIGHVILICNPKHVEEFNDEITSLANGLCPDDVQVNVEDIAKLANKLSCIVMPHYWKAKSLDKDSIDLLRDKIVKKHLFFYEPANYRSLGIMQNHDMKALSGSDNSNWESYNKNSFIELKLRVDSFEQFEMLSKKDTSVVDTLLKKKNQVLININDDEDYSIPIFDDVNVIFGGKGTGKTFVLEKIYKHYNSKSAIISRYNFDDVNENLELKLKVEEKERKLNYYKMTNFKDDFSFVSTWKEKAPPQIKNYIDYISTKDLNKNKVKMDLFNSKEVNCDSSEKDNVRKDWENIDGIVKTYEEVNLSDYLLPDEIKLLKTINEKLKNNIKNKYASEWIAVKGNCFINSFLKFCKNKIELKTETKSKPNETGFYNYAIEKLKLYKSISAIISSFEFNFQSDVKPVGRLADGKNLSIMTNVKMLCDQSKTSEFTNGINDLKKMKKLIFEASRNIFNDTIVDEISKIKTLMSENDSYTSCDIFLGVEKHFTIDEINKYVPSTGEGTMIYLDEVLDAEADVFILDEPEKSLGNDYVNEVIVEKINVLAKSKKTVIVATHNANIAVRTLPYTSILKRYSNSEYETYIGNPFTNQLQKINNEDSVIDWREESQKILEGGDVAFNERGEIYGR